MDGELRGIGRMARECGLSVSALRFYDGAGVLVPARVDEHSAYRYYTPDQVRAGRLVAALRRVGLPLAQVRRVLAAQDDRPAVEAILQAHLDRLADGLLDARRVLSTALSLLDREVVRMTEIRLVHAEFAAALHAVRFAVGHDPALPVLGGVLLEVEDGLLRAVASDRYRLAVSTAPVLGAQGGGAVLVPASWVDAVLALPVTAATVTLAWDADTVRLGDLRADALPDAFPDWRRLLHVPATQRVAVDAPVLRAQLAAAETTTQVRERDGVEFDVVRLDVADTLLVGDGPLAVNREFLLQALDGHDGDELVLELDGPIAPLAIRDPAREGTFSLLMPTRLDG